MLLPELGCFQARPARARARACWLAASRILSLARSAGCARIAIHREGPYDGVYMASCVVSVTATTPRIVMATIVELPAGSYPPG